MVVWWMAPRELATWAVSRRRRRDVGAEAAVVELVEDGSADEFAGAVGVDAVEEAGDELAAEVSTA